MLLNRILCSFLSFIALVWICEVLEGVIRTYYNISINYRNTWSLYFTIAWFAIWIATELYCAVRKQNLFPRLRLHLACAPTVVMIFALAFTFAFDQAMILHSKYELHEYIYGNIFIENDFSLDLYDKTRGFICGESIAPHHRWLYVQTAEKGLLSSNPEVRARSLKATIGVYKYAVGFGGIDVHFQQIIKTVEKDEDERIRTIASQTRTEFHF